jgi:molybdate transport system substrate-binding protein
LPSHQPSGFFNLFKKCLKHFLTVGWVLGLQFSYCQADDINILAASNLGQALTRMKSEFEKTGKHHLRITLGSSGKLFTQIKSGAPSDLFLSADSKLTHALVSEGLADADSESIFALGILVLWSPSLDLTHVKTVLKKGGFSHLSLANSKVAPFGKAAEETLKVLEFSPARNSTLIRGENTAQVYEFIKTGNADLGFVSLSQVSPIPKEKAHHFWVVPENYHEPIQQSLVILKSSKSKKAAKEFAEFLKSEALKPKWLEFGYGIPKLSPN